MKIYSYSIFIYSVLQLILFYANTYVIKFLHRSLFYLTGFYLPLLLIAASTIMFIVNRIKKNQSFVALTFASIVLNLFTFFLYYNYMVAALNVRQ